MIQLIVKKKSKRKLTPAKYEALHVIIETPEGYGRRMTLRFRLKPPMSIPELGAAILKGVSGRRR